MVKISLSKLLNNTGQIPDVPKNPRILKDEKYNYLKQSLVEDPEFTELKPMMGVELNGKVVIIAGNSRLKAMRELGWTEADVNIMPDDTPPEIIRARAVKDNNSYGEWSWEQLANEWDDPLTLESWGLDIPNFDEKEPKENNSYTLSLKSDDLDELQDIEVRINDIISEYPNIKVNLK